MVCTAVASNFKNTTNIIGRCFTDRTIFKGQHLRKMYFNVKPIILDTMFRILSICALNVCHSD